jgi:hypothetical protein
VTGDDLLQLDLRPAHGDQLGAIELKLSTGYYGPPVEPYAKELNSQLEANGIPVGTPVHFAQTPSEILLYIIGPVGGSAGVAAVLRAFFHRYSDKEVKVTVNGEPLVIKGFSPEDTERLLTTALEGLQPPRAIEPHVEES